MLYFISGASVVVHYPLQKKGGNPVATETKPYSFLYKHQFATVHNYSRTRTSQIAHSSDIALQKLNIWLRVVDGTGGGEGREANAGTEGNVFVKISTN